MAKTVIDSLIVTLGLDPKDFKKGEKEAAAALVDLKNNAKEAGDAVAKSADKGGESLMAFGKKVAVVAAIVKTLKFVVGVVTDTADSVYDLSNASRQLGESARNLRNFENVAEMMGGTAEGARKSIQGLKQALFDVKFNGQWSQQLTQISRLGVKVMGAGGRPREFKDVYLDTAAALQNNIATGKMTESDALMFAQQAGFDPGLARSMVGGRDAASMALAQQEKRYQVSGADEKAAAGVTQSITSAGQAYESAKVRTLVGASGKAIGIAHAGEGLANAGGELTQGNLSAAYDAWREGMSDVSQGLGDLADSAKGAAGGIREWAQRVAGHTVSDIHNNPGNLTDGNGNFRTFATREEGLAAAGRQLDLYRGRGNNTLRGMLTKWNPPNAKGNSPANLAAYIADVSKQTGINPDAATTSGDNAMILSAIANHEGSEFKYDAAGVADALSLQREAMGSRGGGGDTKVDIGEINVHTAATDANGIAGSLVDATRRKFTAAQAPSQGPQ